MRGIAIAVFSASLLTCGHFAVAQIVRDVPGDSTLMDAPAMGSTPLISTHGHSMSDDASLLDWMARYPMRSDPMNTGLLSKDVASKMGINKGADSSK